MGSRIMLTTLNLYNFQDAFQSIRPNNFSYDGLEALFDYLEVLERDIGQIELDVIALCYDYTEYKSLEEYQESYGAYGATSYPTMEAIEHDCTVIYIEGTDGFIAIDH
jgi:hypothetical protein